MTFDMAETRPDVRRLAEPLPPGANIGILGGGQLGRMLALAAARLGFMCHIYCDVGASPASHVSASETVGAYEDLDRLAQFAGGVDIVTYEFENVPVAAARHLAKRLPVSPPPRALEVAQDRLVEKEFIASLGIPVAPFLGLSDMGEQDLAGFLPGIVKTRRFGYDGKGQVPVENPAQCRAAIAEFGDTPLILEKRIDFAFEVSVLIVRGGDGATVAYDMPRNEHRGGILRRSAVRQGIVPDTVSREARAIAAKIAEALDYVGVLAVELFYLGGNAQPALIVNEIAPRVHNSGHWTMDACAVDQFENHIRAVCGWPLGDTTRHCDIEMVNLIGSDIEAWHSLAAEPGVAVHLYGKHEARPGRKMGHVNRVLAGRDESCD